jgi:predicted MFS family arabinose efflux permease
MGQAVAPVFGGKHRFPFCSVFPPLMMDLPGFAAHYSSWRMLQVAVGFIVLLAFIFMFLYFPETDPHVADKSEPKLRPIWVNPLRPLALLRNPNLLFVVSFVPCCAGCD